jgi:hypothetical protein
MTMEVTRLNPAADQSSHIGQQTKALPPPVPKSGEEPDKAAHAPNKMRFTRTEKEYFADAFPAAAAEIRQHVLYQKNGVQRSSSLGTVMDRRG